MDFTDDDFRLLQARDGDVFERFFFNVKDKVYSFLLVKAGGDETVAGDVFSDTFYSALKSVHKVRRKEALLSWIMTIASRRFTDHLRKKYRRQKRETELSREPVYDGETESLSNEEEEMILYRLAMEQLKPRYAEIITMKYVDELSQKEIALRLGKHEKAIEGLLFRARKALKAELDKLTAERRDVQWTNTMILLIITF